MTGVLHLMCGKIAAGKSTLAARLAEAPDSVLVSEDQLLARLYPGEIVTLADYVRCAGRLREAIAPHIQALLRGGMSVVLDFPANTLATRAWMRTLFEDAGADHVLHYLRMDDETARSACAPATPPAPMIMPRATPSSTCSPPISSSPARRKAFASLSTIRLLSTFNRCLFPSPPRNRVHLLSAHE